MIPQRLSISLIFVLVAKTASSQESKTPPMAASAAVERIVVKFHEGTRVRLRNGQLEARSRARNEQERIALDDRGLSDADVSEDLARANAIFNGQGRRLFTATEESLTALTTNAPAAKSRELADLNLYFELSPARGATFEQVAPTVAALNALRSVQTAYAQPPAERAQVDIPPVTPSFALEQGYLNAAPGGIDARHAWTIPGGNGAGVRVVDIEGDWRTTHEDMPALFHQGGTLLNNLDWRNHGTAVLGVIAGGNNPYGVTGIAWGARAGYEGIGNQSTASAITNAAAAVGAGGVVLIELHTAGPSGTACTCNFGQCGYVAVEYWQAEFDAIAAATANGVIVVEAAGNGSANLDDPRYLGRFDRNLRDSGAIVVAAGSSTARAPMCWTNYGGRIDAFGWGENVTTMGYGDRFSTGGENQFYTANFSGTSSASPIVVGAVASLQGVAIARGRALFTAREMRQLLFSTGTPQTGGPRYIARMPDLRRAIAAIVEVKRLPWLPAALQVLLLD